MSYLDTILQQKYEYSASTGKEPEIVEVNETVLHTLTDELNEIDRYSNKDSKLATTSGTTLIKIAGLKVVITNKKGIRVK